MSRLLLQTFTAAHSAPCSLLER